MLRRSSKYAVACLALAICTVSSVGQTFDDPTSAIGSPQGDGTYAFNSSGYSIAGPALSCNTFGADVNDVWLAYIPSVSTTVTFTVCPSSPVTGGSISPSDSSMALWDDLGGAPNAQLDCQDGGGACGVGQSEVNFSVTAGNVYYVQLTNWGGSAVISGVLAIGIPPPPGPFDDCLTAYTQTGPGAITTVATTSSFGGSASCAGGPVFHDQWIAYTATINGLAYASTCASSVNAPGGNNAGIATFLAAFTSCPAGAFSDIACDFQFSPCGFALGSEIAFPVTAGNTYYIQLGDWASFGPVPGVTVAFNEVIPPPSFFTDDCSTAALASEGVYFYDTSVFTVAGPQASCSAIGGPDGFDGWMAYTPSSSALATFTNCSASTLAPGGGTTIGTDTYIAVWDGTSCPPTTQLGCMDGSPQCGVGPSEVTIAVTVGNTYYVQVGNWGNSNAVQGNVAIALFIPPPPSGPGDDCTVAVPLTAGVPTPYNSAGFVSPGPAASCSAIGGFDAFDFWFSFVAPATGTAVASNCPGSGIAPGGSASPSDTYMAGWDGSSCPPSTQLTCMDGSPNCGVSQSEIQFPVTAGQTYFVQVGTWGSSQANSGGVNLAFILPPTNDDCVTATPIFVGSTPGSNIGATTSSPTGSCGIMGNDVWYSFVVPCSGKIILDCCGSPMDTVISVWDNCPGVEIGCNDDSGSLGPCQFTLQSYLEIPNAGGLLQGQTIYIAVGGFANQTGTFTLNIRCDYVHAWTTPSGAGSIQLENVDGPPNAIAFSAITVDILHLGLPANVQFPNGWFFGVPIGFQELQIQLLWPGGLPFTGLLNANGYLLNFTLPAGTTSGLAGLATIWSVGVGLDPLTGFASVADTTDPTAFPL